MEAAVHNGIERCPDQCTFAVIKVWNELRHGPRKASVTGVDVHVTRRPRHMCSRRRVLEAGREAGGEGRVMERIDVVGLTEDEARALITPEMLEEGERTMAELRRVMDSLSEDTGQTAYSSLMEPCPFCGGRAWIQYREYPAGGGMEGRAVCGRCHVSTSRDFQGARTTYLPTGEDITKPLLIKQVIETWNRRAGK